MNRFFSAISLAVLSFCLTGHAIHAMEPTTENTPTTSIRVILHGKEKPSEKKIPLSGIHELKVEGDDSSSPIALLMINNNANEPLEADYPTLNMALPNMGNLKKLHFRGLSSTSMHLP